MRRTPAAVLSATTFVVAFGLSGCGAEPIPAAPETSASAPVIGTQSAPQAPLPPPEALTGVLTRLADPAVPGTQKIALVQYATPEDGAALDRFARATVDGGLAPLIFTATDLSWFTFPMQFTLHEGAWQLTRVTADQLLELGPVPTGEPPR